ncbi:helix-turn-helix transcriptional regulator [Microbacterium sp. XT11]|uniref:helix-turn-helix transcriptional regulator n=1 Tax=Microbacterium sp. XT11 TaxID=367477 RepID=UPI00083021A1|nr:helix-turn-helix transcriptional regulator [Microbacterium sp. XT11]
MGTTRTVASAELTDAVELVESALHGRRPPSPRAIDALRAVGLDPDTERWTDEDRVLAAARIMALSRLGQTGAAAQLADRWRDVPLPPPGAGAPPVVVLGLSCAVAEAKICAGDIGAAGALAERLVANALDLGDALWILRSRGILAAASALSRDHDVAEEQQREMRALRERHGWDRDAAEFLADAADASLAFTALDLPRLQRLSGRLHRLLEHDPNSRPLCQLVDAAVAMLTGDDHRMVALSSRVIQAGQRHDGEGLLARLALHLQAFALIRRNEPLRALGLLRQQEPEGEHVCCPNQLRAVAHLRIGDPRSVLSVTTECMRIRPRHNLHTMTSILLYRGLAHLRMQMTELGHREIGEAFAILGGSVPADTFSLLHPLDRRVLIGALELAGDAGSPALTALREGASATADPPAFPVLTRRERAVAEQLRLPRSFPEIAAALHVAPSTVKTQALSIYKKLNVSARDDAVGILEQAGYFEQ